MSQQLGNEVERQGKHVQVFGRTNRERYPLFGGMTSYVPTNLQQMNFCLRNMSNLLDLEYFYLKNAVCPFKMYRHGEKRGIWQFSGGIGSIFA